MHEFESARPAPCNALVVAVTTSANKGGAGRFPVSGEEEARWPARTFDSTQCLPTRRQAEYRGVELKRLPTPLRQAGRGSDVRPPF